MRQVKTLPITALVERLPVDRLPEAPLPEDFTSPLHGPRMTARLGVYLGSAFLICFVTGLLSHYNEHPPSFFTIPPIPVWGYRVTQGLHVFTGTACFPLLLAKMYSAYPLLFKRPLTGTLLQNLERVSIIALVASAFLQLTTGIVNVAQWYSVFGFGFKEVHFAFAWIAIGALAVHIAVKLPVIRDALSSPLEDDDSPYAVARAHRRGVVATGAAASVETDAIGETREPGETEEPEPAMDADRV